MLKDKDFPPLKNDLILRVARKEKVDKIPVWIMRQAGRYLPEFREVRAEHDFLEVCKTPSLVSKVTLQPIDRYDGLLDASIIFSDILVICEALGYPFKITKGVGIQFPKRLEEPSDIDNIKGCDVSKELKYVYDAITLTRKDLNGRVPLFGFSGAPWTLASYMIEGKSGTHQERAKKWLYQYGEKCHKLLQILAVTIADYLVEQIKAGAQLIQLFDSFAGVLAPSEFKEFSLKYIKFIGDEVLKKSKDLGYNVPLFLFAKGAHYIFDFKEELKSFSVISLDCTIDPSKASKLCNGDFALQGNMDPVILFADKSYIKNYANDMLKKFDPKSQPTIANLGHGMMPDHDPEHLKAYLEAIKEFKF